MRAIAQSRQEASGYMLRGDAHPDVSVGGSENRVELGDLLRRRARMLQAWADDESIWRDGR